jgi:hypothetical protein
LGNVLILFLVSSAGPPRNNTTSNPKLDGDPQGIKPLTLERDDGETQNLMSSKEDSTLAISSVLPDHEYETAFNGDTTPKARFVLWRGKERWVRLRVDSPSAPKLPSTAATLTTPTTEARGKPEAAPS